MALRPPDESALWSGQEDSPSAGAGDGNEEEETPGRGVVFSVQPPLDPQFWKDIPFERGCILEIPAVRRGENGEEKAEMAVFVKHMEVDVSGVWVQVRFLGASTVWGREGGIKIFSRERKFVHVCRGGAADCASAEDPKAYHVEDLAIFPAGVDPPGYVEKAKKKEWRKLYDEMIAEQAGVAPRGEGAQARPAFPPVPPTPTDRISALRSRLQGRHGTKVRSDYPRVEPSPGARLALEDRSSPRPRVKKEPGVEEIISSDSGHRKRKTHSSSIRSALAQAASRRDREVADDKRRGRERRRSRSRSRRRRGRRSSKRRRDSRSRSNSRGSSKSSSSDSLLPPLQKKAAREPGSVLKMLLTNVQEALAEAAITDDRGADAFGGRSKLSSYFQIVAKPQLPGKVRDARELETLARCLDLLKAGRLPELGDALAGRFLAVESAALTNNWHDAQHLEVIPTRHSGLAGPSVLLQAQRHARQVEKAAGKGNWRRTTPQGGNYNRDGGGGKPDERGTGGPPNKGGGKGKGKGLRKGNPWRAPFPKQAGKEEAKEGAGAAPEK